MAKSQARIRKGTPTNEGKSAGSWMGVISKQIGNLLILGVAVVVIVFAYIVYKQSKTAIRNLVNTDTDTLKDVFFGEKPYMFYCDRGTGGGKTAPQDNAVTTIPGLFTDLHGVLGTKLGFATLNCSQVLPSGKTIWDRFKLKKEMKPAVWGLAPWTTPKQAFANHLKDLPTLKKFTEDSLAPKATKISSQRQLMKFCQFDAEHTVHDERDISPTCIVLLKGKKHSSMKSLTELEHNLVSAFPKTKFVTFHADSLRFTFENHDFLTPDAFGLHFYAIRNGTHFLELMNPPTWDYANTFVSNAIAAPLYDYQGEGEDPWRLLSPVELRKFTARKAERNASKATKIQAEIDAKADKKAQQKKAKASSSASSAPSAAPKPSATKKKPDEEYESESAEGEEEVIDLSDDENEEQQQQQAAAAAAARERELKRREEMERAERSHLYEEAEASSEEGGEDDDNDNEEEEIVDDSIIEL